MEKETTIVSWAASIHRALSAQQLDADALFEDIGLDIRLLHDPDARYPVDRITRLWERAAELTGNPAFSLQVPNYVQPGTLHGLGLALLASQSLRDAARRLERFSHIVSTAANVVVHHGPDHVGLELVPTCAAADAAYEAFLGTIVLMTRMMLQQPTLLPKRAELIRPPPPDITPYRACFGECIEFDSRRWMLHFDAHLYDQPLPSANAMLATANDTVVQGYLARFSNDILRRTRQAVIDELASGLPSLDDVAARLHMSSRSLQRKLEESKASFSELRDSVQREMAEQWVANSDRSLAEITFRLGFSDQSNFSKAFKRWTGQSPGQYRQCNAAGN